MASVPSRHGARRHADAADPSGPSLRADVARSLHPKPIRWLRAISRHGGTTSGGPTFGYQRCLEGIAEHDPSLETLDLSSWKIAFAGAEPVRAECLEAFAKRFERARFDHRAFYPCYGLAESTQMVTGVEAGRPLRTTLKA